MRIIVCAATLLPSGLIVCGARHSDRRMLDQCKHAGQKYLPFQEGFIDQYGQFVDRTMAWQIAFNAGQIKKIVNHKEELYSENLY